MKIAIVGNSHIGALKRGWDQGLCREFEEISLTFFGARNTAIGGLEAAGNKLVASDATLKEALIYTSGGKQEIEPLEYDALLAYGMCRQVNGQVENERKFYTKAVRLQAVLDYFTGFNLLTTCEKIRSLSVGPLYAGLPPLAAEHGEEKLEISLYRQFLDRAQAEVFNLLDCKLVGQPEETMAHGGATKARFSKGSQRLAVGLRDDETAHVTGESFHMNADYGAMWLRNFLQRLEQTKKAASQETALS